MSLSTLFARLGAPLANVRWSWGATKTDGTIILRVWQDETTALEGGRYVRLINRKAYRDVADNLGFAERCDHVRRLVEGAIGYAVICRAEQPVARARKIVSFDDQRIIRLGKVKVIDGDEWGEIADRVPRRQLV